MYKTLLGREGFRKVAFQYSFICVNPVAMSLFRVSSAHLYVWIYYRVWISISKDMMSKLWPVKTSLLLCVMQTKQILLISCNGKPYSYCGMSCEDYRFHTTKDIQYYYIQYYYFRYSQAGTPVVKVASSYNAEARTFSLKFRFCSYHVYSILPDDLCAKPNALPLSEIEPLLNLLLKHWLAL